MTDGAGDPYWGELDIPRDEAVIWRYRSFPQFVSIIEQEGLWFNRLDQFKDPFEGSMTDLDAESRKQQFSSVEDGLDVENAELAGQNIRRSLYANCWHERNIESAAMWDIYSRRGQAVAIKTTVGDLLDAIADGGTIDSDGVSASLHFSRIMYADFENEHSSWNSLVRPFYKRKSFSHESEVRLILYYTHVDLAPDEDHIEPDYDAQPAGIRMNLPIDDIIQEIRISPWAEDWFVELVNNVCQTYGYGDCVSSSELDADPNIMI